jgi:hypothetical protein
MFELDSNQTMNKIDLENYRGKRVLITFGDPDLEPAKGVIYHTGDYWEDGDPKPYPYEFEGESGKGNSSQFRFIYSRDGTYAGCVDKNIVNIQELSTPVLRLDEYSLEELNELEEQIQKRKESWKRTRYKVTFYVEFNPAQHQNKEDRLLTPEAFKKYIEDEVNYELARYCFFDGEKTSGFRVEVVSE